MLVLPAAISAGRYALHRLPAASSRSSAAASGGLFYTVTSDERVAIVGLTPAGRTRSISQSEGQRTVAVASPDGAQIVYLHAACPRCSAAYEIQSLSNGETRVIGSAAPPASSGSVHIDAAWSSDGGRLAFTEQGLDAPSARIFLLDEGTGARRPLVAAGTDQQSNPVWSPDGSTIAYLSGESSVVTAVDAQTGAVRPLNDQLDHATDLAWSPDGRYLSVLRNGELWLVEPADGHGFRLQVPGTVVGFGGWAPGSRSVVVTATDLPFAPEVGATRVLVIPVDSGPSVRLASGTAVGDARWSPDGRTIAWTTADAGRWTLWNAPSTGGTPRQLASGTGTVTLNSWR